MIPADPGGQLRAEDVSFAYLGAPRAALRHVNLGVTPGEVVLITGASGCHCLILPPVPPGATRGLRAAADMADVPWGGQAR